MKLTIERAALLKSLAHVQSVVERRNTIPILANVLIEAKDDRLELTATDMDLTVVEQAAAEVAVPGATTVSAHTLYDIVRKLPEGAQLEFASSGEAGQMTLSSGRSAFTLATLPKEDFPTSGAETFPQSFTLAAGEIRNLIDRTRFAISTEETRYYLNGIYLHGAENGEISLLRAVATDGHRLARFEMPLPEGARGMPGVIVPRKTVGGLRKLIEEGEQSVQVALSEVYAVGLARQGEVEAVVHDEDDPALAGQHAYLPRDGKRLGIRRRLGQAHCFNRKRSNTLREG